MSSSAPTTVLSGVAPGAGWPADDLEPVSACPVCGGTQAKVLLDGVIDNVFFVAPGRWTLHRCGTCRSAYLGPRPTPSSIGRAYGRYYTHAPGGAREDASQLRGWRLLRRKLANGYMNRRYGTRYSPDSGWGAAVAGVLPGLRHALDVKFRYLPKPAPGDRLLDIGCGNGDFLRTARDAGWEVMGLEPDPAAAAIAAADSLDVRVGMIEQLDGMSACFNAITLSHVIEHVYSPVHVLASVHRLLGPGGVLYIDTPNIDSRGAREFGVNWRGLEAPRHLVLFNIASLRSLLARAGFIDVSMKRRLAVAPDIYRSSYLMAAGQPTDGAAAVRLPLSMRLRLQCRPSRLADQEFITLTARKPGGRG